jgi:hypothetical protein
MRLQQHLNEMTTQEVWEEIRTKIERDCKPFLKHMKGAKNLLHRGMSDVVSSIGKKVTRTDRTPRYISSELASMLDKWGKKHWKFPPRSQAVFTTINKHNASKYGSAYSIWPIGNFQYAWNNNVDNIYGYYDNFQWNVTRHRDKVNRDSASQSDEIDWDEAADEYFKMKLEPELSKYRTNMLNVYLKASPGSYTECIVKCKSYYYVHNFNWEGTLKGWFTDKYWRG